MKSVLMVIPFRNVYPPMNGGMLRCFNLLYQLCRHFNVTAIMHQDRESFMKAVADFPDLQQCRIISTKDSRPAKDIFSMLPVKYANAFRYRYWNRSFLGPAGSNFLALYPLMKDFLQKNKTDVVILEDMEILNLAKLVKNYQPRVPVIYDAYNVNTILAATSLAKGEISARDFELVKEAEKKLFVFADKVFTCSGNDLAEIRRMNGGKIDGAVVPNGVVIPRLAAIENNEVYHSSKDILFCGSMDYLPNREGLTWFLQNVFQLIVDALPGARLLVVGRGDAGEELSALLKHPAIVNYGMVDSVDIYYQKAAVAIVPLLSGSGTRLKLLEAMAYKAPIVATSIGAEGIDYTNRENILNADEAAGFANSVVELLNDRLLAQHIAAAAFSFVENKYDWNIIGDNMSAYLHALKN